MTPQKFLLLELKQDVWDQHLFCLSEDEAVSRAVALVDERVGDLLVSCLHSEGFGCATGAWLTVAIEKFGGRDYNFPPGFDRSRYIRPPWDLKGVSAARDRLCDWADRAVRFRDRPARAAPGERATVSASPGRLPAPAPAG